MILSIKISTYELVLLSKNITYNIFKTSLIANLSSSSNDVFSIIDSYFTPFSEKATIHSTKLSFPNVFSLNYLRKLSVKVALAAIIIKSLLCFTFEQI